MESSSFQSATRSPATVAISSHAFPIMQLLWALPRRQRIASTRAAVSLRVSSLVEPPAFDRVQQVTEYEGFGGIGRFEFSDFDIELIFKIANPLKHGERVDIDRLDRVNFGERRGA